MGINQLDGYQEVLDEVLTEFDFQEHLERNIEARGSLPREWGSPSALAATLIRARDGHAESIENLITGYEAMNQGFRTGSFYVLSLVKQPEITRYLLSYVLSDELTSTSGMEIPVAWLPAEALIKAHATYHYYDFMWEATTQNPSNSIEHATHLARRWIEENIDPELLEDITVFSY